MALAGASLASAAVPPEDTSSAAARRGAKIVAPRLPDRGRATFGSGGPGGSGWSDVAGPSAAELGLQRQDDGSWIYVDPGRRFSARIDGDGRVHFGDRWRRPDRPGSSRKAKRERGRCCGAPAEGVLRAINPFAGIPSGGPSEWAFRLRGLDPVAAGKADMLARTREFRARLALAWHKDVLAARVRQLPGELERLWADPTLSAAERRKVIFQRWDDCEDALVVPIAVPIGGDALGRSRRDAAARARAAIERFVRTRLPPGSPEAFTAGELQDLNATRQSGRPFSPYAARTRGREQPGKEPSA